MKKLNLLLFFVLSVFLYSCDDDNNPNTDTFKDSRDGQVYKTVKIGKQTWMADNLKYLPSVVGLATGSDSTAYYYVHGYDGTDINAAKATSNFTTYGVLYNWNAATNGEASSTTNPSEVQGVCPTGWHLPSNAEWKELTDYLGGSEVAGGKLKETGTVHWNSPNTDATNETGFTALPGGDRTSDGRFINIREDGYWWSATEYNTNVAYRQFLSYCASYVLRSDSYKSMGFSVRCVKD